MQSAEEASMASPHADNAALRHERRLGVFFKGEMVPGFRGDGQKGLNLRPY